VGEAQQLGAVLLAGPQLGHAAQLQNGLGFPDRARSRAMGGPASGGCSSSSPGPARRAPTQPPRQGCCDRHSFRQQLSHSQGPPGILRRHNNAPVPSAAPASLHRGQGRRSYSENPRLHQGSDITPGFKGDLAELSPASVGVFKNQSLLADDIPRAGAPNAGR